MMPFPCPTRRSMEPIGTTPHRVGCGAVWRKQEASKHTGFRSRGRKTGADAPHGTLSVSMTPLILAPVSATTFHPQRCARQSRRCRSFAPQDVVCVVVVWLSIRREIKPQTQRKRLAFPIYIIDRYNNTHME